MSGQTVPFVNVLSDGRLTSLEAKMLAAHETERSAESELLLAYYHLRQKMFSVASLIQKHGCTDLQLEVSNVLMGKEAS